MWTLFKTLVKQPYWVIALLLGVALIALPYLKIDKDHSVSIQNPTVHLPIWVGISLLLASGSGFWFTELSKRALLGEGSGLDLTRVTETGGVLSTNVAGCEIRVVNGKIQDYANEQGLAIVLPCNEYFDDECVGDTRSALGAYVNSVFDGQVQAFITLTKDECRKTFGAGVDQQKTNQHLEESFGPGRCLLLKKPLNRSVPIALISTTTQRSGQGLASQISYLFDGMRALVARLADERIDNVAMPVLGSGHGRLDAPLALVGLLLAISEAARYGQGGQRLKMVTIVVFKPNAKSPGEVDPVVIRRALALIGSGS
jgi:hypothetical protein